MTDFGVYIVPEREEWNAKQYDEMLEALSVMEPDVDAHYAIPRGGGDFPPELTAFIQMAAGAAAKWIFDGVGSDAYKKLKEAVIRIARIKPPQHPFWPAGVESMHCKIDLHFNYRGCYFIVGVRYTDEESAEKALQTLPAIIEKIADEAEDNQYFVSWNGEGWEWHKARG